MGHLVSPHEAIANLTSLLDSAYKKVATNFNENSAVRMDNSGKRPALTITNLDKLEVSPNLALLNEQISGLLPQVDLTELILEMHAHTGFLDEFTHVSELNARADELPISICAVLLAEACNIAHIELSPHLKK